MVGCRLIIGFLCAAVVFAQTAIFPLKDIRPGMRGVGKTVFSGNRVEDFQVEILGVLENVGPKQSVILARLSGGPLANTGVMQGMSGSPVYIQGKLAGAVALTFQFSKEPIAGIRPIEEMLQVGDTPQRAVRAAAPLLNPDNRQIVARAEQPIGDSKLIEIATPIAFAGFTRATVDGFTPLLRELGLEPVQGVSGGGNPANAMGKPGNLLPGSMITVALLSGDMTVGADGTVTYIDGQRMLAFGHRFLAVGTTELPFARADVLALLPNLSSSFKISSAREWMGTITQDRSTAIAGQLGKRASLVPLTISIRDHSRGNPAAAPLNYQMQMVNDPILSPLLLQMAVFSAIDSTQRTLGASSFDLQGRIEFQDGSAPIRISNIYTGDSNIPVQASLGAALPLSYVLQSGFDTLRMKNLAFTVDSYDQRRQMQIDQVWTSTREVHPGEEIEVTTLLTGENGTEATRKAKYRVPLGAPVGPLCFTVSDGNSLNFADFQQLLSAAPRSPAQVVSLVNRLRDNRRIYVRVWRPEPGYQVVGQDFPDPPPSIAQVLGRAQPGGVNPFAARGSRVTELEIPGGEVAISGSKTVQVEVKEQ